MTKFVIIVNIFVPTQGDLLCLRVVTAVGNLLIHSCDFSYQTVISLQ